MEGEGGQGAKVRAGEIQPLRFVPAADLPPWLTLTLGNLATRAARSSIVFGRPTLTSGEQGK